MGLIRLTVRVHTLVVLAASVVVLVIASLVAVGKATAHAELEPVIGPDLRKDEAFNALNGSLGLGL